MGWVLLARTVTMTGAVVVLCGAGPATTPVAAEPLAAPAVRQAGLASADDHDTLPQEDEDAPITNEVSLRLDSDGVLHGTETITFNEPAPEEFTRTFVTQEPYDNTHDRRYEVTKVTAEDADGETVQADSTERESQEGESLDVTMDTAGSDTVVLHYEVRGATDSVGEGIELEWAAVGGYSEPVAGTTVVVDAPAPPIALSCTAGAARSSMYCTVSDMGGHEADTARFMQANMEPGQSLGIVVTYPADTAPGTPILDEKWTLTSAFAITPGTASVFGLLLVVLVGGLVMIVRERGRDERAVRAEAAAGDSSPLAPGKEGMRFRPPDDVHPGQIGTLIDEQADVVDITATIVDLAVRGHLTIRELPHEHYTSVDWQLERLPNGQHDPLLPYERLLIDAIFGRRGRITLAELGSERFADRLAEVRDELYRDMVRLKWFARRPNLVRSRWTTGGIALTAVGVLLTVLLAVFTQAAFTGLAVIIAGAAVTVGGQFMPAKTSQGSLVFAHTLGFRSFLMSARAEQVPEQHRVSVFSRYLPYAIIFDNVDRWARVLAAAGADQIEDNGLPWYKGPEDWRLQDFAESIKMFTLTLAGVISNTRQFRTLN
ncbi:hypothetical protein F4561_004955 [Lipingzhangella halophila]|uniref:Membrane protein DUF2207 n=1 Tax=Lipingzhangella halophila TaxID=1783352 RepID=A0A7W7RLE0_9ACTN|nr:DUF2207 domain-containing protein [Lipingzhangella halophila]MBB4934135.1 hypothetical protein [Lipingzhangella halophila]